MGIRISFDLYLCMWVGRVGSLPTQTFQVGSFLCVLSSPNILLHSPTSDGGVSGRGKVWEKKRCGRLVLKGIGDILDIENFRKISM